MLIKNALLYCPDHVFRAGSIYIQGDRIQEVRYDSDPSNGVETDNSIGASSSAETAEAVIDAKGCYVIPGLIDIHLHGCVGADFSDGTEDVIRQMAEYLLSQGITGFTPATMTLPVSELEKICRAAASYAKQSSSSACTDFPACARFLGIHMEGPYFSEKKKGAQPAEHLRLPSVSEYLHFQELAEGYITQFDVAPELPGAIPFIEEVSKHVTVSLGHSAASYEDASAGFEAGASHVTHMFNGMMPFAHRDPGIVGAAADHPNVCVEMICDGVHLHPSMVRSMFRLFGEERILLISDSMRATGMPDGSYTLGGQDVCVRNGVATLSDGTIAGSVTNLMECVRRVVSFGIPLESAIRCASENQARELGLFHEIGSLEADKYANLVLLDQELKVQKVMLEGKLRI